MQVEREQLRAQMQECVRNEQYAEAALLQEQLKALAAKAEAAKPAEPAVEMAAGAAAEPEVEAAVPGVKGKELPTMNIADIAKFNNWDHRECAVANKDEWKDYMDRFLQENPGIGNKIPKKIHQIWIGPKQPPIVWIDTWRKKYRSQYPGWDYTLWTDKEVAELPLRMQNLYDKEKMYQCKADLLRLEVVGKKRLGKKCTKKMYQEKMYQCKADVLRFELGNCCLHRKIDYITYIYIYYTYT